jgi:hypothetical protein
MRLANPDHRKSFILWQLLGIADLVTAVTMGTTARLIEPHGIATSPMTVLPLSLIVTFAVPLLFILHILCIAQGRHWHEQKISSVGERLPASVCFNECRVPHISRFSRCGCRNHRSRERETGVPGTRH